MVMLSGDSKMMELKEKLAICCRLLCMEGLIDWSGHVSTRIPGSDKILIHPNRVSRLEVRPEDIITIDLDGKLVEGKGKPPGERYIHTYIYKVRKDVLSVAHIHAKFTVLLSMREKEWLPISRMGHFFLDGIPTFNYFLSINNDELGQKVANMLGDHRALFLRGHGAVVVGKSIEATFFSSLSLEREGENQVWAAALGDVKPFAKDTPQVYVEEKEDYRKWWDFSVSKAKKTGFLW